MPSSKFNYAQPSGEPSHVVREEHIEYGFIGKLQNLKYEYRADIRDRAALERNFREKFEALNRVKLSDGEFARLLDEIVTPDVFTAAKTLRSINAFTREDGTPLNYTLVNIKDWCKNSFEVVNQLRINTDYSHHRYDVLILINGVPCVQIELKTLGINPRRAMEQIVDYKNDPGNGYTKTLLSFLQLFIVSNRTNTYYFANNNARHFAFNADERFLPIYQFADEAIFSEQELTQDSVVNQRLTTGTDAHQRPTVKESLTVQMHEQDQNQWRAQHGRTTNSLANQPRSRCPTCRCRRDRVLVCP
jgi:type I restriction enzyme R subunit